MTLFPLGVCEEIIISSDGFTIYSRLPPVPVSVKNVPSRNRLLTSGWWAFARKPVSTLSDRPESFRSHMLINSTLMHVELYRRLGAVPYMGSGCRLRVADPLLLLILLHLRACAPVFAGL